MGFVGSVGVGSVCCVDISLKTDECNPSIIVKVSLKAYSNI